ncbi:N-acetylmuramoyl-L-alanine amidase [Clostridium sporogenes]|uniref:N-acetylmuramoyl-L-alanine amidase n=1 Tax=Clostridium sporogenes TaxID=1509 RepID=UPI0013D705CE|nr:N-acetylmuramoyl-L-alanine amidase [Clostridium sporogenes]NFD93377.1 N-acetylmuramoyl-L-alanine amidase [Clostridium sporogenes]NFE45325.1 N-acetylmuramoyl-L-alanine amidase [Clostridium sporogenes]NFF16881.1 N-acetylmuramoyl-L-alanine amidase [Clostridium sporogenes]NFF74653.1 N-acetylmuramoyl-L-alanine amidase [Clostridium sporogenes]NFF95879.1 N-acetylmuramoyl-L-alanine amidase [Clostridium sporogenes]
MLFNLNPGHTLSGGDVGTRGINGLKEEVLTRQLVGEIDKELRGRGHSTNICRVDYVSTLQESLNKQVALCNSVNADLNICIHFNTTVGGYGSEVYTYSGKYLVEADRILKQLNNLGFRNRGIKDQPLALTKRTKAKTIYIEVCFIDSSGDVAILNKYGMNGIAKAIVSGVLGTASNVVPSNVTPTQPNNNLDGKVGIITGNGVNVRLDPKGKILGSINKGDKVKLYRLEGDWYHCYSLYSGYNRCYIHKNYISVQGNGNSNSSVSNLDGKTGIIFTPSGVNIREKKSTNSKILGALPNGAKVQLYRKEGDWIHIYYPPHGGYIYAKYVRY